MKQKKGSFIRNFYLYPTTPPLCKTRGGILFSFKDRRGQMLMESMLGCAILMILMAGFIAIGRTMLLRGRLYEAARFGSLLQATGLVTSEVCRSEIKQYLSGLGVEDDGSLVLEMGPYKETPAALFYDLQMVRLSKIISLPLWLGEGTDQRVTARVVVQKEK